MVRNTSLILPYEGQVPKAMPGFTVTAYVTGLEHPRRLLVLPNGDVIVAEQRVGYLTLLRDSNGDGKVDFIQRYADDFRAPYGLAYRDGWVLVADQDAIWRVPHVMGAVRGGRPSQQRVAEVPPDQRKPTPNVYLQELITRKGVFGVVAGHQNHRSRQGCAMRPLSPSSRGPVISTPWSRSGTASAIVFPLTS